jgi:hypothetical protein
MMKGKSLSSVTLGWVTERVEQVGNRDQTLAMWKKKKCRRKQKTREISFGELLGREYRFQRLLGFRQQSRQVFS